MRFRARFAFAAAFVFGLPLLASAQSPKEYYEIRQYTLQTEDKAAALDSFLTKSLYPALKRAGAGAVGLLAPASNSDSLDRFVIVSYQGANQIAAVAASLDKDEAFQAALAELEEGGPRNPPYGRIASELLVAMDCMPTAKMPAEVGTIETRVYELRVYESANEGLGDLKVEMFNEGEVPIFLDSGIQPVFIGQALISPYAPSLSYLTAYESEPARQDAWKAFIQHPDWKVLSGKSRYKGTVSKIHKFVLRSLPGSDM